MTLHADHNALQIDLASAEQRRAALSPLEVLGIMLLQSRECDRREGILFRQGKGYVRMPAAGLETVAALANPTGILAEIIDLRTLVPCDWGIIRDSVSRTNRLVVVQEDVRTSSFGQAIITELVRRPDCWDYFAAPPQLVSRSDVPIGFNPILERAVLPNVADIECAVRLTMEY